MTQEQYFATPGVSNSALNALQKEINPVSNIINSESAFRFGKLYESRVQDIPKTYAANLLDYGEPGEREMIDRMYMNLCKNEFAMRVMKTFKTQVAKFNDVTFNYNGIKFTLSCKCLYDWWLDGWGGGDLKTFSGNNFLASCKRFQWIESRVFYMLVARVKKDFIIGCSKERGHKVEQLMINWGDRNFDEAYPNVCKKAYDYFILKY